MAGNLNIAISEQMPVSFNGQIAREFDLNSFGDWEGGGGDDPTSPCIITYRAAVARCDASEATCDSRCDIFFPWWFLPSGPIANLACHTACGVIASSCHDSAEIACVACLRAEHGY
jgi:hypothetical protein